MVSKYGVERLDSSLSMSTLESGADVTTTLFNTDEKGLHKIKVEISGRNIQTSRLSAYVVVYLMNNKRWVEHAKTDTI